MRHIARRITPSTVLATLAIVVACTGSAVAGSSMVGTRQVIDNSLTGRDIHNGSIQRADLAAGARTPVTITRNAHQPGFTAQVRCAADETAVGGGGAAHGMDESRPIVDANGQAVGWVVSGNAPAAQPQGANAGDGPVAHTDYTAEAYVICQRP